MIAVVLMVLTEPAKLILVALGQGGYLGLSGRTVATALLAWSPWPAPARSSR